MEICLVSFPTVADLDDPAVAQSEIARLIAEKAPLGILSLAAVLASRGLSPKVVDLNRSYYRYLKDGTPETGDFCAFVSDELASLRCDIYGFSTICSSYPLTIRIVKQLKRLRPGITVVLGGPQASVVDIASMEAFPFIDFIVRGEAEETLPTLLNSLSGSGTTDSLRGVTYREHGRVVRSPNAPVIIDLDALPLPAFHLYPYLKDCRYVPLELGRGCPFACNFCSTNDFFRRRFRLKSPATMIAQMRAIRSAYGNAWFDLVHDMFTVDRKRVVAFCEALLAAGEDFNWNCSARTDCVDTELVRLMARAGCRGIFFGIETGSSRMQRLINKDLDLSQAMSQVAENDSLSIHTTVSLIAGFPEETPADLAQTVSFFAEALRFDHAEPQFHLLAPLAETPLHTKYRDSLILDRIFSDVSFQGWQQHPADEDLIQRWPAIFPNFYTIPTPHLNRDELKELREFLLHGARRFRWLFVALHRKSGLLNVFNEWRVWRIQNNGIVQFDGATDYDRYYSGGAFRKQFLRFARSRYVREASSRPSALEVLIECEEAFDTLRSQTAIVGSKWRAVSRNRHIKGDAKLRLAKDVRLLELPIDYETVVRRLRNQAPLDSIPFRRVAVAFKRELRGRIKVIKLSRYSSQLLKRCDGKTNADEIVEQASRSIRLSGVPANVACWFGLQQLRADGLIGVARNGRNRRNAGSVQTSRC